MHCTRSPTWKPPRRLGPDLDDLAGDLVAERGLAGDVDVAVLLDLHVGAAGRAVAHLDLDLGGAALGLGHVLEPDVLGGVEPQCLHGVSSARTGWLGRWSGTTRDQCHAAPYRAYREQIHTNGQRIVPECLATGPVAWFTGDLM